MSALPPPASPTLANPPRRRWGCWAMTLVMALTGLTVLTCSGLCLGGWWILGSSEPMIIHSGWSIEDPAVRLRVVGRAPTGIPCEGPSTSWVEDNVLYLAYPANGTEYAFRVDSVRPEDNPAPAGQVRACVRTDPGHEGEAVPLACLTSQPLKRLADRRCPRIDRWIEVDRN